MICAFYVTVILKKVFFMNVDIDALAISVQYIIFIYTKNVLNVKKKPKQSFQKYMNNYIIKKISIDNIKEINLEEVIIY